MIEQLLIYFPNKLQEIFLSPQIVGWSDFRIPRNSDPCLPKFKCSQAEFATTAIGFTLKIWIEVRFWFSCKRLCRSGQHSRVISSRSVLESRQTEFSLWAVSEFLVIRNTPPSPIQPDETMPLIISPLLSSRPNRSLSLALIHPNINWSVSAKYMLSPTPSVPYNSCTGMKSVTGQSWLLISILFFSSFIVIAIFLDDSDSE